MSDADIQVVERTGDWKDEAHLEYAAKVVCEALTRAYPNHAWTVGYQGGALIVKNLAISSHYGMVLPQQYTLRDLTRNSILMAGEYLERAGMARGAWDGEMAKQLDGSEERFFNPKLFQ